MMTNKTIQIVFGLLLCAAANQGQAQSKIFEVGRDGFSFPNYTGSKNIVGLTPSSMERLCGPDACARGTGDSCVLSGYARALKDQNEKIMQGGRCDGMAAVGEALFKKYMSLNRFSSAAKRTFDLKRTPRLESEIAYYWMTQGTEPTVSAKYKNLTPNQMLQVLRNPGNESYSIHIYNTSRDQWGRLTYQNGHAVTAIRVTDYNNNTARVFIYDNNFPNQTRFITVYKGTNTWTYGGYPHKNIETKVINLVPLSARMKQQRCWVGGNDDVRPQPAKPQPAKPQPPKPQPAKPQPEQQWDDEVYDEEYYEDDDYEDGGQYHGHDNQTEIQVISDGFKIVSDIISLFTGASVIPFPDTTSSGLYRMPSGVERLFKLRANNLRAKMPTDLYVSSGGHIMALEGLRPHRGQEDDVVLGADGESLSYSTKFPGKITLRINETYVGADYEIKIMPVARKGGYDLHVRNIIDVKNKNHELELQLSNKDGTPAYYTIEMTRIGDKRNDVFAHRTVRELVIRRGETDRIAYGKWMQDKQPLAVEDVVNGQVVKESLVSDEE